MAVGLVGVVMVAMPEPVSTATRTMYVTNRNSSSISVFAAGSGGQLTLAGVPTATATAPRGIALSPDGRVAYVVSSAARTVSAYTIGDGGALTPLGAPINTGGELNPFGLALNPNGRTLYVISQDENVADGEGEGALLTFAIEPGGTLTQLGTPTTTGTVHPRTLSVTPDGRFLFIGHGDPNFLQTGAVTRFAIGDDGVASLLGAPIPAGISDGAIAISPDGRFLYVPGEVSGQLFGFAVGDDGSLEPVPGSPLSQPDKPIGTAVTPDGRYLYVTSLDNDTVYAYRIGADGALTPASTHPAGDQPDAVTTSPDGRHLYVSNFGSDNVSVFDIGQDGSLLEAAGSPVSTGGDGPAFGSIVFIPNQGPVAAFSARARPAGQPTRFDASASSDVDGSVARYDWDFGDGTVAPDAGPTPRHTYRHRGVFTVTVTVTDNEGCAAQFVFTGHSALCTGSPAATAQHPVTVGRF